jgi:hypothetical protein
VLLKVNIILQVLVHRLHHLLHLLHRLDLHLHQLILGMVQFKYLVQLVLVTNQQVMYMVSSELEEHRM